MDRSLLFPFGPFGPFGIGVAALLASGLGGPAAAQCTADVPVPGGPPPVAHVRRDVAVAADGRVWVTQLELNQIASYDPATGAGTVHEVPTLDSGPHSLTVDAAGDVWFTETNADQIGRFSPATETFQEYPAPGAQPYGIVADDRGGVWFTAMVANAIAHLDPATGRITQFPLTGPRDAVENLTFDPVTGSIWVTNLPFGRIVRLDPDTATLTRFEVPWLFSTPHSIAVAPNGLVWFTDIVRNSIGRLDPTTGAFRRFPLATPAAVPHGIIVDFRGIVWFAELQGDKVGLLLPFLFNLRFELDAATPGSSPYFLAEAPNGEIWYSAAEQPVIGRLPCTARPAPASAR